MFGNMLSQYPPTTSRGMGQGLTGAFGQMPTPMQSRESIGPSSQQLWQSGQADKPQQSGMSYQSPSQGLFAAYMSQLFNQKYRPQQALGGYQNFGAFGGFMPQQLPPIMRAPTQAPMPGPSPAEIDYRDKQGAGN